MEDIAYRELDNNILLKIYDDLKISVRKVLKRLYYLNFNFEDLYHETYAAILHQLRTTACESLYNFLYIQGYGQGNKKIIFFALNKFTYNTLNKSLSKVSKPAIPIEDNLYYAIDNGIGDINMECQNIINLMYKNKTIDPIWAIRRSKIKDILQILKTDVDTMTQTSVVEKFKAYQPSEEAIAMIRKKYLEKHKKAIRVFGPSNVTVLQKTKCITKDIDYLIGGGFNPGVAFDFIELLVDEGYIFGENYVMNFLT